MPCLIYCHGAVWKESCESGHESKGKETFSRDAFLFLESDRDTYLRRRQRMETIGSVLFRSFRALDRDTGDNVASRSKCTRERETTDERNETDFTCVDAYYPPTKNLSSTSEWLQFVLHGFFHSLFVSMQFVTSGKGRCLSSDTYHRASFSRRRVENQKEESLCSRAQRENLALQSIGRENRLDLHEFSTAAWRIRFESGGCVNRTRVDLPRGNNNFGWHSGKLCAGKLV